MIVRVKWSRPVAKPQAKPGPGGPGPKLHGDRQVLQLVDAPAPAPKEPAPVSERAIIGKLMLEAFGASDKGCVRSNNEDCFLVAPLAGLYLVADGMGGAQAGEHASRMATDTVKEFIDGDPDGIDAAKLMSAIEHANKRIKSAASADTSLQGMGTTMVVAAERGPELVIASVGDSRAYTYKNGALTPVTEDQTWVNEVGRKLGLDEDTLRSHPMRHVLTMAIGVSEQLRINTYSVHPEPGTLILLSSDGLHGVVSDDDIRGVLDQGGSLEASTRGLIALAKERGGPDNVTVVLIRAADPNDR